jgi:hypothetical protein
VVFGGSPVSTLFTLDRETGTQLASTGIIRLAAGTPVVINDLAAQPGTDVLFGTALNLNTVPATCTPSARPRQWPRRRRHRDWRATLAFGPDRS